MADFPPVGMIDGEDSRYYDEEHVDNLISSEAEDGYEITRPRTTRRQGSIFSTGFTDISQADKELLQSFWESVRGGANVFTWDNPITGVTKNVRFKGSLKFTYAGIGGNHRYNCEVQLKEV